MRPGDLVVTDTDVPFGTRSAEGDRHPGLAQRFCAAWSRHLAGTNQTRRLDLPAEGASRAC